MKIVLDTNVLVSGLICPLGQSGEIVRMVASGSLNLSYDVRIISEYQNVLLRPKFSFDKPHADYLLDQIASEGEVTAGEPLCARLPDSYDEPFLEVAIAGGVQCLITLNLKYYPSDRRQGVLVLSPTEFLEFYRKKIKLKK